MLEAERRGFPEDGRRVILGDGAAWIWNVAAEMFPGALQIVDLFHAKEHLWEVSKALHCSGGPLTEQWAEALCDELDARDTFIGWDADQRSRQLHRVIGLSRFLIRSSVHCRNLASKALGLALRRLPDDFQHRYGYRPLLVETFVEKGRYQGTSLAAANWLRTCGPSTNSAAPGWAMYAWGSGWCKLCRGKGKRPRNRSRERPRTTRRRCGATTV